MNNLQKFVLFCCQTFEIDQPGPPSQDDIEDFDKTLASARAMYYYCRPSPEDVKELDQLQCEMNDAKMETELYEEVVRRQNVNIRLCAVCGMEH